ncbi:MAG: hypothetical protein WAT66_04755 [Actinomycetota bacterium]
MIEETWDERELPILQAIYRARAEGDEDLDTAARTALPELEDRILKQTLADLVAGGYLDGKRLGGWGSDILRVLINDLTPLGLRTVGAWPSGSLAAEFIKALTDRVAAEGDPERQKLLTRLLETSVDVGKGVLAGVLTHVTTRGL